MALQQVTIPASLAASLSLRPSEFLNARPHIERLMASAMVFRGTQTLLIRRAATDSYPLRWEIPGGSTSDRKDASLVAGAVRELHEETGLRAKTVLCAVGMVEPAPAHALRNLGIAAGDEDAQNEGDDAQTVTFLETGRRWGKVTLVVGVHEDGDECVRVRDGEHDRWSWVGEDEVRAGRWTGGEDIEFVSEGCWRTILQGFRVHREREAARLMARFPGKANREP
jgi:8-oxo-dGTP pyrophosphatase MutT (NUDIX family)